MTTIDDVVARLEGVKRSGKAFVAKCPAHEDHRQSLGVSEGNDGRVLLKCYAGCDTVAVCGAMGFKLADLFADRGNGSGGNGHREIVATYDYTDEEGDLLYQVVRFEPKDFRQRRRVNGGWVWKLGDVERVLYHLPEIRTAIKADAEVWVTEGEKDADALRKSGQFATCNAGGAGKWRDEYTEALAGASVVIVADRDEPGRKHAARVAQALEGTAAAVRVVEAAAGKDAYDHLMAGKGVEEFIEVDVGEVPVALPSRGSAVQPATLPLVLEAAHAAVLADEWRDAYRWAQHENAWRRWTGRVWKRASEQAVVNAAQKVLRKHYAGLLAQPQTAAEDKRLRELHRGMCRHASVSGGLAFLKGEPGFHTEFEQWDADAFTVNCADGLLDLRSQSLRPHDPAALCTKSARWSFAEGESTGAWERHLRRCLPDEDVRRQVQRDLGRALVGTDLEESLPIWYGTGANGKSTTARTILQGVGEYGRQAVKDLLVASRFERHSTDLADLAGSRLVVAEEVEDGKRLDEATVKNLTGGNRKKARFMRGDNFEFEQTFSIFLLVNHRPLIAGTDNGIWRRVRLVPWSANISFADQRPQDEMVAELMADGAWMLRWMVAGLADWQADHHWVAAPVEVATADYRAEQDVLAGFIARRCVLDPRASVSVADLFAAYDKDTDEHGDEGVVALTKTVFGKRLKGRNLAQERASGGVRVWRGIGLTVTGSDRNTG